MNTKRIYLTGFMTSGKSTLGPILANVLGMNFFDLDREVEKQENLSVVDIFEKKGEKYFREVESDVLNKLSSLENVVISLGGGTMMNDENFNVMKNSGKIVYLKVSPSNLYRRLRNKIDRPLFRDLVLGENPQEDFINKIKDLLDKRKVYYEKADLTVNTDLSPIGITVDKIAKKILRLFDE
jgi:shikimate kinase